LLDEHHIYYLFDYWLFFHLLRIFIELNVLLYISFINFILLVLLFSLSLFLVVDDQWQIISELVVICPHRLPILQELIVNFIPYIQSYLPCTRFPSMLV